MQIEVVLYVYLNSLNNALKLFNLLVYIKYFLFQIVFIFLILP